MDDSTPKYTAGRGGRGAAILKALQSLARQPGQVFAAGALPAPAVPPPVMLGGAGVQETSATALPSPLDDKHSSASLSSIGSNRGALISQLIQCRSAVSTSFIGTPVESATEDKGKNKLRPSIARGRAELLRACSVGSMSTQPRADPLKRDFQDHSNGASSMTESLQQLNISDVEEKKPVNHQGNFGTKFSVSLNWIRLSLEPDKAVFEYEVKFDPQIEALNLRFQLLNSVRDNIGSVKSFDGVSLWLPIKLHREIVILHATNPITQETETIKIIYKKRTDMTKSVQLYNVLFSRIMRVLKMARIGKSYYSPGGSVLVPQHKLEIWPGYVTAASCQEGGVMLCVDLSHRILRTETCYDVMVNMCRMQKANFKALAVKDLVGCVVLTRYNNKTYRIDDILFDQNANGTFTNFKGEEVKYVDYYYNVYGIKIKDPQQPLLVHRVKKKELRDQQGSPCNPEARQILADWGLTMEDDTISVDGRTFPPETIFFGNREVFGSEIAEWSQESYKEKVITPVDLKPRCWLILFSVRDQFRSQKFAELMKQVTRSMGVQVGEPQMVCLPDDRIESYVNSLKQFYHDKLQLAVIIFPNQREDRYSAVKRLACVELALPTQCINSRTISQGTKLRSVTQKIALQINCKLGGELWAVRIPLSGLMVCGVDVYHDPTHQRASVVGFVASINHTLTKWYSHASFQHPGDEIVHGLKIALLEALRHYHKLHHSLPRSIMVYRDGISDGQLKLVEDHELPQLATIFHHFDSYEPKLSLIVVQKRVNTRIFAAMSSRGHDNPPPGSIIDHTVTRRYWYDFLLVSQHVRQGTVSPTHYIVVRDGSNLKVDNMQRLTYKLTHLYYNWPGTIRVPAPCQYAHKLANLIGQNVKKEPAVELCDKLFFL
ncbi:piwi-like protein Ago3 [Panulirus ornatus]|uniref:piwi-like protein Ago3 n=1 Tax=Panulirus ornatus TaxID=150431 RepID=UPI003A84C6DE